MAVVIHVVILLLCEYVICVPVHVVSQCGCSSHPTCRCHDCGQGHSPEHSSAPTGQRDQTCGNSRLDR